MEKIKLLIELNKERLKNILEVRGITQEQSHKDFYDGVISELNRSIKDLEDLMAKMQ